MTDKEESEPKEDVLQQALTKLKVDVDWSNAFLKMSQPGELCTSKPKPEEGEASTAKSSRKANTRGSKQRKQPYHKDNLPFTDNNIPSMDNLSFATEVCKNKNCTCNQKGSSPTKDNTEKYPLNFAHVSPNEEKSKAVVQEPRLKVHHREKDRRVVIRAARLKLAKQFKGSKPRFPANVAPKAGKVEKDSIFGGKPDPSANFASLSGHSDVRPKQKAHTGVSFGSYRKDSKQTLTSMQKQTPSAERLDLKALESSLPSSSITRSSSKSRGEKRRPPVSDPCSDHSGRESIPCTCSQQARMDPVSDWTVDELACYFDEFVHIPKKMSLMAEMMYT